MLPFRIFIFVFLLYYASQYNCSVLGAICDNVELQENEDTNSNAVNDTEKGRKVRDADLQAISNNFSDETRTARCIKGRKKRLRNDDADKVAKYFIRGGPLKGHSHFLKNARQNADQDDDANNSMMDEPDNKSYKRTFRDRKALRNSPLVSDHQPPLLRRISEPLKILRGAGMNGLRSVIGNLRSVLYPHGTSRHSSRSNSLPSTPLSPIVSYMHKLSEIPYTVLRAAPIVYDNLLTQRNAILRDSTATSRRSNSEEDEASDSNNFDQQYSSMLRKVEPVRSDAINGKDDEHETDSALPRISTVPMLYQPMAHPLPNAYVVHMMPNNQQALLFPISDLYQLPIQDANPGKTPVNATKLDTEKQLENSNAFDERNKGGRKEGTRSRR